MKHKHSYLRNAIFLLLIVTLFSSMLMAQKKPTTLKLDVDTDDMQLCASGGSSISTSQFCVLFRSYYSNLNSGNFAGAQVDRNEMIEIVRGQVDIFYKQRKDGRSTKIRVFQTILDFLRIGGELAVTIMNGERAKTIVGAALSGLNSGQGAFNKNFQILQTQVLINKMNANRAEIMTEILTRKSLGPRDYSWYGAKNDLRRYLFAGTFDNALDTLVNETGSEVVKAEENLKAATEKDLFKARCAKDTLADLDAALKSPTTSEEATKQLRAAVGRLMKNTEIAPRLSGINTSSEGRAIWDALFKLRGDFAIEGRADLSKEINRAICPEL